MNFKQFAAVVAAIALFAATAYLGVQSANTVNDNFVTRVESVSGFSSLLNSGADMDFSDFPSKPFLARIDVSGTIMPSSGDPFTVPGGYDHDLYMNLVDALMDDDQNKGILLYCDTPGGTVYESDEMYLKLMQYREKTSRPIYAYFASEACSGGYYISMAANEIYANRNAWTGSIGVIISLLNYEGLSEKIGVKEVDITSGRNKAMGSAWEPMTDEQRGIFQSMVNEAYTQFVDIVTAGRKLERDRVLELADGRIYTAQQALDTGLIDHIAGEEDAFKAILEKAGLEPDAEIYIPARASSNLFTVLFSRAAALRPKSDLELFRELTADKRNGALMYYAG
ncbi:MAG: signal peptide peptidase SppA [Oscillospiraceae bacterium]|nr:signal peptide peptidase SppA [Oscillospiraceae bacterium]